MNKRLLIFWLFLTLPLLGLSQASAVDSMKALLPDLPMDSSRVDLLFKISWALNGNDVEEALSHSNAALVLSKQLGYRKGIADAHLSIGVAHWYSSKYDQALTHMHIAEEHFDALGELHRRASAIGNMALIEDDRGKDSLALRHFKASLAIFVKTKHYKNQAITLSNIGAILIEIGDKSARDTIEKALAIATEHNVTYALMLGKSNLADILLNEGELKKARRLYEEVLSMAGPTPDKNSLSLIYTQLGEVARREGRLEEAAEHLEKGLAFATDIHSRTRMIEAQRKLAEVQSKREQFELAYQNQQQVMLQMDSLYDIKSNAILIELQTKYETARRERELKENKEDLYLASRRLNRIYWVGSLLVVIGLLLTLMQITRKKKAQELINEELETINEEVKHNNEMLEAYNKELSQFTHIASHDLKAPLRTISGFASLLERRFGDEMGPEAKTYLNHISTGVKRMYAFTNDLLDYSNTRSKEYKMETVDVQWLIYEIICSMQADMEMVESAIYVAPLPSVKANKNGLQQIFQNLLTNALKFGGTELRVGVQNGEKEFTFYVKDNGIGVSKAHHQKIFDIFKRLHGEEEYEGTGMGLSIVKNIIDKHKGRVWVESESGKGATFFFTLPKHHFLSKRKDTP